MLGAALAEINPRDLEYGQVVFWIGGGGDVPVSLCDPSSDHDVPAVTFG